MNTVIAHLQMATYLAHGHGTATPHPTPSHRSSGHGGGLFDQFFGSAVRGAGWSMGSRIMHSLPIAAVILIAVISVVVYVARRRRAN